MTGNQTMRIATAMLCMGMLASAAAQESVEKSRRERMELLEKAPATTFHLKYMNAANDANEVLTLLRLMLDPSDKLYLVPNQDVIVLKALPDDVATATKLISEVDRPHGNYRVTFALTEMDGAKRLGTMHFVLAAGNGQRVTLKEGGKFPVETGSYKQDAGGSQVQMTYLDVGQNFDVTVNGREDSAQIKYKVEQSAIADPSPAQTPRDPVIRQTLLEGVSNPGLGKPTVLGEVDIPGGTHRLEIAVTLERMP